MIKSIAAITALANAYAWREKNVALRAIADNARELYEAITEHYHLQNGNDGSVDPSRIQLSDIRVQFLRDHQKRLEAAAKTDSSPLLSAPGNDPAAGADGGDKPGKVVPK